MNRRDPDAAGRQAGGYSTGNAHHDTSRQASQWQDDRPRQSGGWDDDRPAVRWSEAGRQPDDTGMHGYGAAGNDGNYSALEREYRGDPRQERRPRRYRGDYSPAPFDASGGNDYADFTSEDFGGRDFNARRVGYGGAMRPSDTYRPSYGFTRGSRSHDDEYGSWREYGESRGFLERAGDEIASWFGDEEASRRREMDHRGRGPSDYTRSDERVREDVNDKLTHDWRLDASRVRVTVKDGEVTLDGKVDSRTAKRRAEDLADDVSGVRHVQNNLRVETFSSQASRTTAAQDPTARSSGTGG